MRRRDKAALFVTVWLILLGLFYALNPFQSLVKIAFNQNTPVLYMPQQADRLPLPGKLCQFS